MSSRRSAASLIVTVATLVLVGFVAGFFARPPMQSLAQQLKGTLVQASRQKYLAANFLGRPAADLPAATLDGSAFRLSGKKGKVILLFFWASWCPYSRSALPAIQAIQERYAGRDDFEVIGVSLDRDRAALVDFVSQRGIRWINLYEDGKVWNSAYAKSYEVRAIPSRWIIGKDSTISGADLSPAAAEDQLSLLLENRHRAASADSAAVPVSAGGCTALDAP